MSMRAMTWLQSSLGLDITGEWNSIVHICVGGITYSCLRKTFMPFQKESAFCAMILGTGQSSSWKLEDGSAVIDRDGTNFRHVLNFLRLSKLCLPDSFDEWDLLLDDARVYQIKPLEDAILAHPTYRRRQLLQELPKTVYLRWDEGSGTVVMVPVIAPLFQLETVVIPSAATTAAAGDPSAHSAAAATAAPATATIVRYNGRAVGSCDEMVNILLSSLVMRIEHWHREPVVTPAPGENAKSSRKVHTVFLSQAATAGCS